MNVDSQPAASEKIASRFSLPGVASSYSLAGPEQLCLLQFLQAMAQKPQTKSMSCTQQKMIGKREKHQNLWFL